MKQTKKMTQWSIISITLEWEWRKNEENICLMFEPGRWIGNPQKQMLIPTVKSIIWNAAFSGDITVISVLGCCTLYFHLVVCRYVRRNLVRQPPWGNFNRLNTIMNGSAQSRCSKNVIITRYAGGLRFHGFPDHESITGLHSRPVAHLPNHLGDCW